MSAVPPALSFALFTPDTFETIRRTASQVAGQEGADRIELLVLCPSAPDVMVDPAVASAFHSVRVIPVSFRAGSGEARAVAVREAAAPVIAFGEDHSYPQPGWAVALLDAHRESHAAVGPTVLNANPATLLSWADLVMGYGPWLAPATSGLRDHLPGHNCSYKREPLLALGGDLAALMEAESPMQWRLRSAGHTLWLEDRARVAHTNFERPSTWLFVIYHAGRVFAATRAMPWPAWRRLAFALASPLIPLVRLRRHLAQGRLAGWPLSLLARVAPVLLLGLIVNAIGQGVGSVAGPGRSPELLVAWDFYRNQPRGRRTDPA